ncbi:hypothetical protein B5C26_13205 [Photorhabdus luminescens]|nr:hypothetical protein B5C26_13205 [Photorhabdus luminescens]
MVNGFRFNVIKWLDTQPTEILYLSAISVADGYIAATSAANGMIVATRDVSPFEAAGVNEINTQKD